VEQAGSSRTVKGDKTMNKKLIAGLIVLLTGLGMNINSILSRAYLPIDWVSMETWNLRVSMFNIDLVGGFILVAGMMWILIVKSVHAENAKEQSQ
jgi:hypothetical protein